MPDFVNLLCKFRPEVYPLNKIKLKRLMLEKIVDWLKLI